MYKQSEDFNLVNKVNAIKTSYKEVTGFNNVFYDGKQTFVF